MATIHLFLQSIGLALLSVVQAGYINDFKCATTDKWDLKHKRWEHRVGSLGCCWPLHVLGETKRSSLLGTGHGRLWHYVIIEFAGGENFAMAHLNAISNNVHQKMAMLMGRRNHTAKQTLLIDFETLVTTLPLNKTSIINPPYD
ncbi:hypothetical protein HispidOSU_015980, partial [Sigmodon hispidus]